METKLILLHILLGALIVTLGAPSESFESSTSTSVSVSTVTRKVTSRLFTRSHQSNDTQFVTEDMLRISKSQGEENDAVAKPLKLKKKILASNLKNLSEKATFPNDKHEKVLPKTTFNVTGVAEGGKPSSSDSDEVIEEAPSRNENVTETAKNETVNEAGEKNGGPFEGRSLEDPSSEENVNADSKAKPKNPPSTTARTTNGYSYETFGGLQKVLNNNYLNNNEGYEKGGASPNARPSPSVILPAKKSSPISRDNFKNAIRFESEYYGPTGQTDWVPIIPDKLPVRSPGQHFGVKLKPPIANEKLNKTNEKNLIVFPSDGVQPLKGANAIPVRETETQKTTPQVRSSVLTKVSTSTESFRANVTLPLQQATKFRGAVRYKFFQSNSTLDDKKSQNESKNNISLEVPAIEIPVTTSGGSGKSKEQPVREETTEISVVSSTNHTTKFQNAVYNGLAVPPENVKMENVTKEPQTKNITRGGSEDGKHNKTQITNSLPKVIEGGQGWIPMKVEKDSDFKTDLVIPKSVVANESVTETEKPSTPRTETTPEDVTTEMTETTPGLTTLPKLATTDADFDVSSQSGGDETLVTVAHGATEEPATLLKDEDVSTTLKPVSDETETADVETSTEVQPTTGANLPQSELNRVMASTLAETSEATPTTSSPHSSTVVTPRKNVSSTTTLIEVANPEPIETETPATFSSTTTALPSPTTLTTASTTKMTQGTEGKEEGIYYKNYVLTTVYPHIEITEENVPAYLRLMVQAKDWEELCRLREDLKEAIIRMLGGRNVSAESIHFLNLNDRNCQEKIEETRGDAHNGTVFLPVNMFLMDKNGDFDKNLSEAFLTLWGRRGLDFELPIRKVDFVTPIVNLTELADPPLGGSVVAAIVISCVAGICVILLGVLFVIMKRRQKRFNYGQRCTPVSLDAYSLDSVSIYNSVRRKGVRASKRSYGNAAFDDPEVPTHPMNFAGLANFSSDKEQLHEEFNIIPQVYPKVEELPAGAETKNRYANIIPLPETRVHLTVKDGDALSDYINANYVRGLKGAEKLYIACQAPMESTVENFWRMVWEQQCKVILMLTDLQENGIEKCADYLPPNEVTDNLRLFGDFQVTLKKRDVKEKYIISDLKLKNMEANLWREVTHLWYLGWPDQGVPSEVNSLIAFLIEARSQMKIQNGATTSSPVVVHCSPGTGRTGTVIACDLCIREYEQSRMVDIPRCVFSLRRDRAGAVQTKDQYAFIYEVLNVYATKLSGGGIESI